MQYPRSIELNGYTSTQYGAQYSILAVCLDNDRSSLRRLGHFSSDSPWLKLFVALLWALEIGHQIAIGHFSWRYLVTDHGSLDGALSERIVSSVAVVVVLGVTVAAIVKIFLGWRIYRVSGKYHWLVATVVFSIAQFALGIAFAARSLSLY
ncbi:unnamed protein product [Peniophora sp. CBMAI 1063]|nr:unnamed protein product [Peniophora sp. CBMAI 1063]